MHVYGIGQGKVEECWDEVAPIIQITLDREQRSFASSYLRDLVEGQKQLWVGHDGEKIVGCLITEIREFDTARVCSIILAAGLRSEVWLEKLDMLEGWARAAKCGTLEIRGRPGWTRLMKPRGFNLKCVVMEKSLGR